MKPDADTADRIKNLAAVGKALFESSSDISFNTDFYLALEALNRFEAGFNKLELDDESVLGMKNLIEYLRKKINKRMKAKYDTKHVNY